MFWWTCMVYFTGCFRHLLSVWSTTRDWSRVSRDWDWDNALSQLSLCFKTSLNAILFQMTMSLICMKKHPVSRTHFMWMVLQRLILSQRKSREKGYSEIFFEPFPQECPLKLLFPFLLCGCRILKVVSYKINGWCDRLVSFNSKALFIYKHDQKFSRKSYFVQRPAFIYHGSRHWNRHEHSLFMAPNCQKHGFGVHWIGFIEQRYKSVDYFSSPFHGYFFSFA